MKCFLIAAISLMSLSSFAQTATVDARIENRLDRLNDLIIRAQAHRYIPEVQKREVLENINRAIMAMNSTGPAPTPQPQPQPRPLPQPQPELIVVEGKIESINIHFEAPTIGGVFNQCSDFIRTRLSQADEMMISVNGNAYSRQVTSGWWSGPNAICQIIYNLLTPENLRQPTYQPLMVEGYVENHKVEFIGNSYGEVFNKCVRTLEPKLSQADEMEISVNGDRRYRQTTSEWWTGAHAICTVVMKNVPKL
jgi:hypothetical protein